jgi:hypothetical protein
VSRKTLATLVFVPRGGEGQCYDSCGFLFVVGKSELQKENGLDRTRYFKRVSAKMAFFFKTNGMIIS